MRVRDPSPAVQSLKVDVEVNRGEVSLGGFADSAAERDAAVASVRRVAGVSKVFNSLTDTLRASARKFAEVIEGVRAKASQRREYLGLV